MKNLSRNHKIYLKNSKVKFWRKIWIKKLKQKENNMNKKLNYAKKNYKGHNKKQ